MQVGDKSDETGYNVYNLCSEEGSLTVTGHNHAYGRSHALGDVSQQEVTDECENKLDGLCIYDLYDGQSIVSTAPFLLITSQVAVVGLGGRDTEHPLNEEISVMPHWAKAFTGESGALFCKYNYKGQANLAYCYFKSIKGTIVDEFYYTQRRPAI